MKLLWTGNSPSHCGGQNRVSYFSIKELTKLGYEVHCAGKGIQVLDQGEESPCPCYVFNEFEPDKYYALIDQLKPDIILLSHDVWLWYFLPELKLKFPNLSVVGWFTIDAHPIHFSWFQILRATDYLCVSTDFGKQTVYERFPEKGTEVIKYG